MAVVQAIEQTGLQMLRGAISAKSWIYMATHCTVSKECLARTNDVNGAVHI